MSLATEIESAFEELEAIHGKTFSMGGTDYKCHATSAILRSPMQDAGFQDEGDIVFHVRASQFDSDPDTNAKLTFDGVQYRVSQLTKSHGGATYSLNCTRHDNAAGQETLTFWVTENGSHLTDENKNLLVF